MLMFHGTGMSATSAAAKDSVRAVIRRAPRAGIYLQPEARRMLCRYSVRRLDTVPLYSPILQMPLLSADASWRAASDAARSRCFAEGLPKRVTRVFQHQRRCLLPSSPPVRARPPGAVMPMARRRSEVAAPNAPLDARRQRSPPCFRPARPRRSLSPLRCAVSIALAQQRRR